MNLYEIDNAITALTDPETGELLDFEAFEQLQIELEHKIENIALWVKDLTAEAKAIQDEIKSLTERRDALKKKAQRLESYLMRFLDGEKFTTPRCVVTFRRSKSLQVEDDFSLVAWRQENGFPDCILMRQPEVSKKAITDLIQSGVDVPFAHIVEHLNMGVK